MSVEIGDDVRSGGTIANQWRAGRKVKVAGCRVGEVRIGADDASALSVMAYVAKDSTTE